MSFGTESTPARQAHGPSQRFGSWSRVAVAAAAGLIGFATFGCGGGGGSSSNNNGGGGGNSATVTGTLVENSQPVSGATVSINGVSTTTNANGSFSLPFSGSAGTLLITAPATSTGFQNVVAFNNGSCSDANPTQIPVAAVSSGQTESLGTITVYSKDAPPQPPCNLF